MRRPKPKGKASALQMSTTPRDAVLGDPALAQADELNDADKAFLDWLAAAAVRLYLRDQGDE